jgi:hypothetical protein
VAGAFPHFFPAAAQSGFAAVSPVLRVTAASVIIGAVALAIFVWTGRWESTVSPVFGLSIMLILYLNLLGAILLGSSTARSTRALAAKAMPYITPNTQLVIYDTTLESLPFYLKIGRPIWGVWSGEKASVFGSFYLAERGESTAPGFGPALLSFDEFHRKWATAPKSRFAVFIKRKNLARLDQATGRAATVLVEDRDILLVSN